MPIITSRAKRLRIYVVETDRLKCRSFYHAIVNKAKELNLAGATVFRGLIGYGVNGRIHSANIVDLSCDLPIVIEIIDSEECVAKMLLYLDEVMKEGLVTIDDIEEIKYGRKFPKG